MSLIFRFPYTGHPNIQSSQSTGFCLLEICYVAHSVTDRPPGEHGQRWTQALVLLSDEAPARNQHQIHFTVKRALEFSVMCIS